MGNQFLTAADSVGANIDEGYGRFHHLDRVKFLDYGLASMWRCLNIGSICYTKESLLVMKSTITL